MKKAPGRLVIVVALLITFIIEVATNSVGSDAALLRFGALPDNGQLHDDVEGDVEGDEHRNREHRRGEDRLPRRDSPDEDHASFTA